MIPKTQASEGGGGNLYNLETLHPPLSLFFFKKEFVLEFSEFKIPYKKIAINCKTLEEAKILMRLLDRDNIRRKYDLEAFANGNIKGYSKYENHGRKTCYAIVRNSTNGVKIIIYNSTKNFKEKKYKIVDFNNIFF